MSTLHAFADSIHVAKPSRQVLPFQLCIYDLGYLLVRTVEYEEGGRAGLHLGRT